MKCRHAVGLFAEYLDGRLSSVRARELEEHLAACAACRSGLESLKAVVRAVRLLPSPALPQDFNARVIERLHREPAAKGVYARWLAPALGAAVLALVLAGVLEFAERSSRQPALRRTAVPHQPAQTAEKTIADQMASPGRQPQAPGARIPEIGKPAAELGEKGAVPPQRPEQPALAPGRSQAGAPPEMRVELARPARPSGRSAFVPPGATPAPGQERQGQPTPAPQAAALRAAETEGKLDRGVQPESLAVPAYMPSAPYPSAPAGPRGAAAAPGGAAAVAQAPSTEMREAPKPEKATSVLKFRGQLPGLPIANPFQLRLTRSQLPPYFAVRLKAVRRVENISVTLIQQPSQFPARGQVAPTRGDVVQLVPGQVSQVSLSAGQEQTIGLASLGPRPTGVIQQISISSPSIQETRFLLIRPLPPSAIRQAPAGLEQPAQVLLRLCSLAGVTLLVEPPLPYASYAAPTAPPNLSLLLLLRQMGYQVEQEGDLWTAQRPA